MGDLKSLIRYHRWQLDEKRREVADLNAMLDRLHEQQAALEAEITAEQQAARSHGDVAFSYAGFAQQALRRRRTLAGAVAQVESQIARATDVLREMFQEVKRYELAQDERTRQEKAKQRHRENTMLDEVAAMGFQRRRQDPDSPEGE